MSMDLTGTIIFALFALYVLKSELKIKTTIALGVLATILPLAFSKFMLFIPYILTEQAVPYALTPTSTEITILLLQLPVTLFALLMIRKDNESMFKFGLWIAMAIFVNYMLLPYAIR